MPGRCFEIGLHCVHRIAAKKAKGGAAARRRNAEGSPARIRRKPIPVLKGRSGLCGTRDQNATIPTTTIRQSVTMEQALALKPRRAAKGGKKTKPPRPSNRQRKTPAERRGESTRTQAPDPPTKKPRQRLRQKRKQPKPRKARENEIGQKPGAGKRIEIEQDEKMPTRPPLDKGRAGKLLAENPGGTKLDLAKKNGGKKLEPHHLKRGLKQLDADGASRGRQKEENAA